MKNVMWKAEGTYGVNAFTNPATDVGYKFGKFLENHETPIPWNKTQYTPVYDIGVYCPTELVPGATNVEFKLKFCPLGADDWKYALGGVTAGGGAPSVFKVSSDVPSRSIYFETDFGDSVVAVGCVTRSIDFFVDKDLPMQVEITVVAAEVIAYGPITTTTPAIYNTNLAITKAWGHGNTSVVTLDTVDVKGDAAQISRIHLHVENVFKKRVTTKIVEVKKVAVAVLLTYDIELKEAGASNKIIAELRDDPDDIHDFYYKWLDPTSTYYWKMDVNNIKIGEGGGVMKMVGADMDVYTVSGSALYDSSRTDTDDTYLKNAVAFAVKDGVTYT